MEPSSSSSPTINISQQSKTRKGNTESSPNLARPLTPTEMRQKVVEILASTANGCLQELGYYPGMPARLQELEARNKNWQSENVKLYEDNKRLVETMRVQNESLHLLNAPDAERIQHITNLEMENRTLKMKLDQVMKGKPKADHTQLGQDQNYTKLYKEYMALTETYNRAYHEVVQLREVIRGGQSINQSQQHQGQMSYQTSQQQTLRNAQNPGQTTPLGVSHIPTQAQSGLMPGQHMLTARSSTDVNPNLAGQQQLRRNEIEMQQNRELQRQYMQLSSSSPSSRRMSGNMTNPMNPPIQMQPPYPNLQSQIVYGQPSISPIANLPPQYQYALSTQHNLRPNQVPSMAATHHINTRRASNPVLPSGPSQTSQTFRPTYIHTSSNNLPTPTVRVGSAPLPAQSPIGQLPPHSTTLNGRILPNNPQSTQIMSNPEAQRSYLQPSGHISLQTTISPNKTLQNSPTLIAPTPTVPTNVAAMVSQPTQFSTSNTPAIRQSPQGNKSANASVSIPLNLHHSNIGTPNSNSASPVLHPRTMHLKRESISVDRDWSSESHKKPRLESPTIDQNTPPPPPSPSVPPSTAGRDISMESMVSDTKPIHTAEVPVEGEEEDEEEEEVVEVGPDGLRLVEDILEQVYGENRRGEVLCWFCKHRYNNNYTDIPPVPFIGATDQELEQHCINEHLDAWNQARADV